MGIYKLNKGYPKTVSYICMVEVQGAKPMDFIDKITYFPCIETGFLVSLQNNYNSQHYVLGCFIMPTHYVYLQCFIFRLVHAYVVNVADNK